MSEADQPTGTEAVRERILPPLEEDPDEFERVEQAIEDIPLTSLDEVQTEARFLMGTRGFERQITSQFETIGQGASPLSNWIRGHLDDVDEDYPYRMWKRWSYYVVRRIPTYDRGGYDEFRTFVWKLKELGLLEPSGVQESEVPDRKDKQFYALTEGAFDRPEWRNPQEALYG